MAPADLAPGTIVAGFELERVLGRGGMGVVWLAREPGLERRVAMKVLAPELAADEGFRDRFLAEMRLAASLDHPHVCPVYRAGEEDGLLFLALRFVRGETLGEAIEREGRWTPERAVGLLGDLAGALDTAHANGLLHRDVKPENVLLDEERNVYLADFGLARSDGGSRVSTVASLAGTAAYLAPERIEGAEASRASDLYAFACLAFSVLSGAPPFVREHEAALLFAHVRDAPPSLAEQGLGRLDPVFTRVLAKRPEERYASCREFVDALEEALAGGEPKPGAAAWPETLPRPQTAFVGRERELAQAAELLASGARILTLTGPGGTGKTRLALELAARLAPRFEDGVHWLPLAALRDPELLPAAIARELGEPGSDPAQAIGERRLLLGLDNLEQLLPAAAGVVAELTVACPNLTVIATSRAPLRIQAEQELPVPPLEETEAVALFRQRAEQQGLSFEDGEAVREICRRLDCLPLAVELAAARLRLLPPAALLARLDQRLRVLTGGPRDAPARQQTLTATLDWSHELLPPDEQQLFARLAVFAGGFTLEAAEAVCDADLDTLQGLLDASLLRRRDDAEEPRYSMLAVVQEYAAGKLAADAEEDLARNRHGEHFLSLAEQAEPQLTGPDQARWIARIEQEQDNFREALALAANTRQISRELRIVGSLGFFWSVRGRHLAEGRRRLDEALARAGSSSADLRAKALRQNAWIAIRQGQLDDARSLAEEAVEIYRSLGDASGTHNTLDALAAVLIETGEVAKARPVLEESLALARTLGNKNYVAATLNNLASLALVEQQYERARELATESLEHFSELRISYGSAIALYNIGAAQAQQGAFVQAFPNLRESLRLSDVLGDDEGVICCLEAIALLTAEGGEAALAAELLGCAQARGQEIGVKRAQFEQLMYEHAVNVVRERVADEEFTRCWAAGQRMTIDDAVANILQGVGAEGGQA